MLPFPVMDTSTGSLTVCPTADLYKEPQFCTTQPNWFYAPMASCKVQSFSVQRPTNCQGSKQFPNFALFTTLPGRVRLSQSMGCKTSMMILQTSDNDNTPPPYSGAGTVLYPDAQSEIRARDLSGSPTLQLVKFIADDKC
jgi:hypothetical protein